MTDDSDPATARVPLPEFAVQPGLLDTVRYAAAMWEFQRLHFDHDWARHEGLARAVVQGPLLGNYLVHVLELWAGGKSEVERVGWRNRAVVPVDTPLACGGDGSGPDAEGRHEASLWIRNDDDVIVVSGYGSLRPPAGAP